MAEDRALDRYAPVFRAPGGVVDEEADRDQPEVRLLGQPALQLGSHSAGADDQGRFPADVPFSRVPSSPSEGDVASDERKCAAQPDRSDQVGRPGFRIGDPDERDQEHGRERRGAGDLRDGIEQGTVMVGSVEASEAQEGDGEDGVRPEQLSTRCRWADYRACPSGEGDGQGQGQGVGAHADKGPATSFEERVQRCPARRIESGGQASVSWRGAIGRANATV